MKSGSSIVEIANGRGQVIRIGGQRVLVLAGPEKVQDAEQVLSVAHSVASCGGSLIWGKAETEDERKTLMEAGEKFGLPMACEISSIKQCNSLKNCGDVFVVESSVAMDGSFYRKLQCIEKPLVLRKSLEESVDDFLTFVIDFAKDFKNLILCVDKNFSDIPLLKNRTSLPVLACLSPSYIESDLIESIALGTLASGADGLMVGLDENFDLNDFDKLMHNVEAMAPVLGKAVTKIRTAKKEKLVCAYSGKKGAYAEQAVGRYFDSTDVTAMALDSFAEIFESVLEGKADYGMVPIENSLNGSVYQNYDNFCRYPGVTIVGSVTLNIRHALLGIKGSTIQGLKTVYSHPQGFGQCKKFLNSHKSWMHVDSVSTATAAKFVSDKNDISLGAIASTVNAELYGLDILKEDIEDDPNNFTRFLVIQSVEKKKILSTNVKPNMASFIFKTKHEPGALYKTLGILYDYQVNLTRLESRPLEGHAWEYWFYADVDLSNLFESIQGEVEDYVKKITDKLGTVVEDVRLLGVYPENRP